MSESQLLQPLVQRWARQCELSAEDREAILRLPAVCRSYGKDAYIVREGERATECTVLLKGYAFRQKLLSDGGRQIISFHIPGEFVDLQNGLIAKADNSVQAMNRTEVAAIPRDALMGLAEARPAVRLAMWFDTLIDGSISREWVVNVGRRDSRTRIAHLLCELVLRISRRGDAQDATLEFPITQEQMADATGLTPVHTNRTLQTLRREGLIQLGNGLLRVLDWDALRQIADFDELYLHHHI